MYNIFIQPVLPALHCNPFIDKTLQSRARSHWLKNNSSTIKYFFVTHILFVCPIQKEETQTEPKLLKTNILRQTEDTFQW